MSSYKKVRQFTLGFLIKLITFFLEFSLLLFVQFLRQTNNTCLIMAGEYSTGTCIITLYMYMVSNFLCSVCVWQSDTCKWHILHHDCLDTVYILIPSYCVQ